MVNERQIEPTPSRRARTDARLTAAVNAQLQKYGYGGLTIERVSAESGVAKTTIYRRWASKGEMVFDLTLHQLNEALPPINTGSLAGDIRALAEHAVELCCQFPGKAIIPGLLADFERDSDLRNRFLDGVMLTARQTIESIFARAQERGELNSPVDINEFHATLLGVPFTRCHLFGEANLEALSNQLTSQLLSLIAPKTNTP